MKTIKLSYNQSKKLCWNGETVRVRQNGEVLYLQDYGNEGIVAKTWLGTIVNNVTVVVDDCFK